MILFVLDNDEIEMLIYWDCEFIKIIMVIVVNFEGWIVVLNNMEFVEGVIDWYWDCMCVFVDVFYFFEVICEVMELMYGWVWLNIELVCEVGIVGEFFNFWFDNIVVEFFVGGL